MIMSKVLPERLVPPGKTVELVVLPDPPPELSLDFDGELLEHAATVARAATRATAGSAFRRHPLARRW